MMPSHTVFSCDSSSIGSNVGLLVGRSVGLSVGRSVGRSVTNHELEQSLLTQFQQYISVIVQCNDPWQ